MTIQRYGWRRDALDRRDYKFAPQVALTDLPSAIDLRPGLPPIYNQGELGSCTANAIAALVDFERKRQNQPFITPSRLFIYYNERQMEGTVESDAGAQIRDGIKSVASQGVCPEAAWPYVPAYFRTKPTDNCYAEAVKFEALLYQSVTLSLHALLACLAQGFPFVVGISVFASFESQAVARTGVVPMPRPGETMVGGHAVDAVGYEMERKHFIMRNSWDVTWGQDGYFTIPFEYLTDSDLADDRWTLQQVK